MQKKSFRLCIFFRFSIAFFNSSLLLSIGVFLGLSLAISPSASAAVPLALKSAVSKALESNKDMGRAREKINEAEAQIPVVRSKIFPELSVVANSTTKKDAVNSNSVAFGGESYNSHLFGVRLVQPLLSFGIFSAIDSSKKDIELRQLDAEITQRDLSASVIKVYYQVILFNRNLETLKRQQEIVQSSLRETLQRQKSGRSSLLDVLQVRTEEALLKAQLSQLESEIKVAVSELAYLMGDSKVSEIVLPSQVDFPSLEKIDYELLKKDFRAFKIEKIQLLTEQVQAQKQVTRGRHLPSLNLTAGYDYNSTRRSDLFADNSNSWNMGLQLSVPLFSGLSSIYQQRVLLSQQQQLEFERLQVISETEFHQISSREKLEAAHQSIESGAAALKLAQDSVKEAQRQFRFSTLDLTQYLNIQRSLFQAESALNSSKYNYLKALTDYYSASGQPMTKLVTFLEAH